MGEHIQIVGKQSQLGLQDRCSSVPRQSTLPAIVRVESTSRGGAAHESHKLRMRPREGVDLVIGRIIFRVCNEQNDILKDSISDSPMWYLKM